MSTNQVYFYKCKINQALAERSSEYWEIVKKWLKCIYSNDELDIECRKLFLTPEDSVLHTNFKISLMNRLKANSTDDRKPVKKRSQKRSRKRPIFEPAQVYDYVPLKDINTKQILFADGSVPVESYSAQELFLPDKMMILGRLLIASGENDIEDATDGAAEMIVESVQIFLKNVLSAILTNSRGYKTCGKQFRFNIGVDTPNPWNQNSLNILDDKRCNIEIDKGMIPIYDKADQMAVYRSACHSVLKPQNITKKAISIDQVYNTLKLNRNVIANHSVYTITMEQIALELDDEESHQS